MANPTITAYWGGGSGNRLYRATVTTNDTDTVTIYADRTTPPTTSFGTLAGGATTTITIDTTAFQPPEGATFTAYVQMKATGRTNSDIVWDVSNGFNV